MYVYNIYIYGIIYSSTSPKSFIRRMLSMKRKVFEATGVTCPGEWTEWPRYHGTWGAHCAEICLMRSAQDQQGGKSISLSDDFGGLRDAKNRLHETIGETVMATVEIDAPWSLASLGWRAITLGVLFDLSLWKYWGFASERWWKDVGKWEIGHPDLYLCTKKNVIEFNCMQTMYLIIITVSADNAHEMIMM